MPDAVRLLVAVENEKVTVQAEDDHGDGDDDVHGATGSTPLPVPEEKVNVHATIDADQGEIPRRELETDEAHVRDEPAGEHRAVFEIVLVGIDQVLVEEIEIPRVQRAEIGGSHGSQVAHGGVLPEIRTEKNDDRQAVADRADDDEKQSVECGRVENRMPVENIAGLRRNEGIALVPDGRCQRHWLVVEREVRQDQIGLENVRKHRQVLIEVEGSILLERRTRRRLSCSSTSE